MSLKKFLLSKSFFKQIIIAIFLAIVLIFATMQSLKIYTHHGESFTVPDFSGLNRQDAAELARNNNLEIEIIDSVYIENILPGVVVDQTPESGFEVKQKRTVFLTVNSFRPDQVTLPKLTDISFRQAKVLIENSGLEIGQINYQPSEYNDLVLKVQIDSTDIEPGINLAKGSKVDLIIGRTEGNITTPLPELTGLTTEEARMTLTNALLNLGVIIYDNSIITKEDSIDALVWQQRPNPELTEKVNLGTSVDLWLTVDESKFEETTEPNF